MVLYVCPRCNYNSNHRGNFKNHLNRKKSCNILYNKVSISEIKEKYNIVDKESRNGIKMVSKCIQIVEKGVVQLSSECSPDVVRKRTTII